MKPVINATTMHLERSFPNEDGAFGREAVMDTDHFLMMKKVRLLSGKNDVAFPSIPFSP